MEKINISELLRDCPKGMELDCTMYEDVYFDYVEEFVGKLGIIHCYIQHETRKTPIIFNSYGTSNRDIKSKCVIFPRGKTTWEGFHRPFKDGDVLYVDCADENDNRQHDYIFILNKIYNGKVHSYCHYYIPYDDFRPNLPVETYLTDDKYPIRFASEEEKQKLFDAIKANGYHWDAETKTLSKLPKFKIGNVITNNELTIKITHIDRKYYYFSSDNVVHSLPIESQDEWKVVTQPIFKKGDKVKHKICGIYCTIGDFAEGLKGYYTNIGHCISDNDVDNWELVIEPIFKVGNKIRYKGDKRIAVITGIKNNCYFIQYFNTNKNDYQNASILIKDQDKYELVPNKFDINTLKPFDKVLVRTFHEAAWKADFFSHYTKDADYPFSTVGKDEWYYCIPYKGNEYLHGTTDDCNNFYKTWE